LYFVPFFEVYVEGFSYHNGCNDCSILIVKKSRNNSTYRNYWSFLLYKYWKIGFVNWNTKINSKVSKSSHQVNLLLTVSQLYASGQLSNLNSNLFFQTGAYNGKHVLCACNRHHNTPIHKRDPSPVRRFHLFLYYPFICSPLVLKRVEKIKVGVLWSIHLGQNIVCPSLSIKIGIGACSTILSSNEFLCTQLSNYIWSLTFYKKYSINYYCWLESPIVLNLQTRNTA